MITECRAALAQRRKEYEALRASLLALEQRSLLMSDWNYLPTVRAAVQLCDSALAEIEYHEATLTAIEGALIGDEEGVYLASIPPRAPTSEKCLIAARRMQHNAATAQLQLLHALLVQGKAAEPGRAAEDSGERNYGR